jgi:hypothetical protein
VFEDTGAKNFDQIYEWRVKINAAKSVHITFILRRDNALQYP